MPGAMDKSDMRKHIKGLLASQSEERIRIKSFGVWEQLKDLPEFIKSSVVMFYVSTKYEVDTRFMIDESIKLGKTVVVPFVGSEGDFKLVPSILSNPREDLEKGFWGIEQPKKNAVRPIELDRIGLVVVPAIAFDRKGYRLGRGKGFYDRFLCQLDKNIPVIGIAFDFQLVDSLPICPHDIPVKQVLIA